MVRHLISIPAGLAGMTHLRFTLYTLLGAGLWVSVLTWLGYAIGANRELILQASHQALVWVLLACAALVESGKAVTRPVKVDRQVDNLAVIAAGLKGGEQVVTLVPRNLRPELAVTPLTHDTAPAASVGLPENP